MERLFSSLRFRSFVAATALSLLAGACVMSQSEFCSSRMPELDRKLADAAGDLSREEGRQLASGSARLGAESRDEWRRWAEHRLVETQHYIDDVELADTLPAQEEIKHVLSDVASDLVSFHGYALQGKGDRMARVLARIQARAARARGLACAAPASGG